MASIVGVHGIGQQFKGPQILHTEWFPALCDGVSLVGGTRPAPEHFACAFYGDLFRKDEGQLMGAAEDLDPWGEEFMEHLALQALAVEAESDPHADIPDMGPLTAGAMRLGVNKALQILTRIPYFGSMLRSAVITDIRQVRDYLLDASVRAAAQQRVVDVVSPTDTKVIVAHSLGSVVAYETLVIHPEWQVDTFITLGSPLGMQKLVFQRLNPTPVKGRGIWPGSVKHWVNVSDRGDIVSLERKLHSYFGDEVKDHGIQNGWSDAHSSRSYLTSKIVGQAIAAAL